MEPPSVKATSKWDWAVIDLTLISLFAAIITIHLFTLSLRLHRLEKQKVIDLENGRHDVNFLHKFRDLQSTDSKGPFDEKTFQSFVDRNSGLNPKFTTVHKDQKATASSDELPHLLVKFFHLESSKSNPGAPEESTFVKPESDYTNQCFKAGSNVPAYDKFPAKIHSAGSPSARLVVHAASKRGETQPTCLGCAKEIRGMRSRECLNEECGQLWCLDCDCQLKRLIDVSGENTHIYCTCGATITLEDGISKLVARNLDDFSNKLPSNPHGQPLHLNVDLASSPLKVVISTLEFSFRGARLEEVFPNGRLHDLITPEPKPKGEQVPEQEATKLLKYRLDLIELDLDHLWTRYFYTQNSGRRGGKVSTPDPDG